MAFARIYRSAELGEGESATSFVSRLAVRSGCSDALEFCAAHGSKFRNVILGNADTIASLAQAADVDLETLLKNSLLKDSGAYSLAGVRLAKSAMSRSLINICPHCLQADIQDDRRPSFSAYGRALWQVTSLRTCPRHDVSLVSLGSKVEFEHAHDFAWRIRPYLGRLAKIGCTLVRRSPSDLERYLAHRLERQATGNDFLDSLEFNVVAKTCEEIGVLETNGPAALRRSIDSDGWSKAGGIGFSILAGGLSDFTQWLKDRRGPLDGQADGFGLGVFHKWLKHAGPSFDPIREIVAEQVFSTTPLPAGTKLYGRNLQKRRLWSVNSVSIDVGIAPRLVSKLLEQAFIIPKDRITNFINTVFLADNKVDTLLKKAAECICLGKMQKEFNLTRIEALSIVDEGLVVPLLDRASNCDFWIWNGDVEKIRQSLIAMAVEHSKLREGVKTVSLRYAARHFSVTFAELASAILTRKISAYRLDNSGGMAGLHVGYREVYNYRSKEYGFTFTQATRYLNTNDRMMNALVYNQYLMLEKLEHKKGKLGIITYESMRKFESDFVIISSLARQLNVTSQSLHAALRKKGIPSTCISGTYDEKYSVKKGLPIVNRHHIYRVNDLKSLIGQYIVLGNKHTNKTVANLENNTIIF